MNELQFNQIANTFGLTEDETKTISLGNLNSICIKGLHCLPYSTLQVHTETEPETKLEWNTIFDRLIVKNLGGLCYERDEILYQVLTFIGYEAHRIEASGIIGSGDEQTTAPRYDHMAVGVKLDNTWYLCDIGWGGYMCQGAVEISEKVTKNKRFSARCVQSNLAPVESSNLVPGATRWWDLEFENPTWEYPDYDNFIKEIDGTWKKSFRFKLESSKLEDFLNECHLMNTDKSRTLYNTSILARCGEKLVRGEIRPYWRGFFGFQELEIVFLTNKHWLRSMKLHASIDTVNQVIDEHLKIQRPSDVWRCASTIPVIYNPLDFET